MPLDLWKHVTAYFNAIQNYVLELASESKDKVQRMTGAYGVQVSMGFSLVIASLFALALNPALNRRHSMLKNAASGVASAAHYMNDWQREGSTFMDSYGRDDVVNSKF